MTDIVEQHDPAVDTADGTVFELLATEARDRAPLALWTTAIGGVANASLIWWRMPSLHWFAAGFAAVAAYGIWGLADHALTKQPGLEQPFDMRRVFLATVRGVTVPAGIVAAIAAAGGFMAAALGGWNH